MPYGPGKFEGQPPSTFFLYQLVLDAGYSDICEGYSLIEETVTPSGDEVNAARSVGYTNDEIQESIKSLSTMAGAIVHESDQGFVNADIYDTVENLMLDWNEIYNQDDCGQIEA